MIPKIIHYCWFGGKPLPKYALRCIASWRKFLPDYQIKEWNESNFEVNMMSFTAEAYAAGKYAFVSDVARFWVLYNEGGLYFDTDVELVAPMDDIIGRGPFMGVEVPGEGIHVPKVNPGLGLGVTPAHNFYREVLEHYQKCHFINPYTGRQNIGTVVSHNTDLLELKGLKPTNEIQQIDGIWIYPKDYFNPFDDATGILSITDNTRSIHWYSKTWCDRPMVYFKITRLLHRMFGEDFFSRFKGRSQPFF